MARRANVLGLLAMATLAGCLSPGDPPRGKHLLAGRDNQSLMFQPTAGAAPTLVVFRSDADGFVQNFGGTVSLFAVSEPDPATGVATVRQVVDHAYIGSVVGATDCGICATLPTDARGRWLVSRGTSPVDPIYELSLVDPETGARLELGRRRVTVFARGLFLLIGEGNDQGQGSDELTWTVRDLDGGVHARFESRQAEAVGDDVYFVSSDEQLFRVAGAHPDAPPDLAAPRVESFAQVPTARGTLLLLMPPAETPFGLTMHALLDTATSKVTPLPGETEPTGGPQVWASSTGKYLFGTLPGRTRGLTALHDRDAGTTQLATISFTNWQQLWRPAVDELWLEVDQGVTVWRPGQEPARTFENSGLYSNLVSFTMDASPFTPDGRYVLRYAYSDSSIHLHAADDPGAEPLALSHPTTSVSRVVQLPDGRLLVQEFTSYHLHADIVLVDPVARTSRAIATGGHVVVAGATRVLALLDYVRGSGSGTLTLIDLTTGTQTVLGENVSQAAVDTPETAPDRLPPGARVAFLVRNRIASPYDGLWTVTLP